MNFECILTYKEHRNYLKCFMGRFKMYMRTYERYKVHASKKSTKFLGKNGSRGSHELFTK